MKHSFTGVMLSVFLSCMAVTLVFGQGQEVPVSVYGPPTQVKEPEEVKLYDVTKLRSNTMVVNRAHWTHGATGVVYTENGQLPVTHSMKLLTEDPAETYSLPLGRLSVTLDLGDYYDLNELIFYSVNAEGVTSVEYTNKLDGPSGTTWKPLADKIPYGEKGIIEIPAQGISARYVRITFDTSKAGEIASLSMLGTKPINVNGVKVPGALENFAANQDEVYARNLAGLHRGTSVSHVSSGNLDGIDSMLDNDFRTGYTFDDNDETPIWVVQMPKGKQPINKVSLLAHSNHSGTVEFYLVDSIPVTEQASGASSTESHNGVQKINLPPEFFENNKPFHKEEVHPKSDWRVSSDPMNQKKTEGQYIVMRWVPAEGASTQGDPLVVKQVYATQVSDFKAPEIASYALTVQSLDTQIVEGGTRGFSTGGGISTVDRVRLPQRLPAVSR